MRSLFSLFPFISYRLSASVAAAKPKRKEIKKETREREREIRRAVATRSVRSIETGSSTYGYVFAKRLEQQPIEYLLVLEGHQFVAIHPRCFVRVKLDHVTRNWQDVSLGEQYALRDDVSRYR